MSDLAKWKVHGPVKTLKSEFATWDLDRQDWQPDQLFTVAAFRPDGAISTMDAHNPDGSIAHSRWLYDEEGRMTEFHSWIGDGPIRKTVYLYDEAGRPTRTMHLNEDGTRTDSEVCGYDANHRKTKVRYLFPSGVDSECRAGDTCGASTGYAIEGTDSAYTASGATTMTVTYDENNLPAKASFHDANNHLISYVLLTRDSTGRLLSEEMHQSEISPFRASFDKVPAEERDQLAAVLKEVIGGTLSSTTYGYDVRGRLEIRELRMGNLGGQCTTYRYGERDEPIEETTEHNSRSGSVDETGNVQYSSVQINVQHNQLEYLYDAHGNWTERIVSLRSESEPNFQRSNIERRTINYHST